MDVDAALDEIEARGNVKILPERYYGVWFDGACKWEPVRLTGYGFVVDLVEGSERTPIARGFGYVNEHVGREYLNSSNVAEYKGLMSALEYVQGLDSDIPVMVFGDSKLVINQLFGAWGIKTGAYVSFAIRAATLVRGFGSRIDGMWVPREKNNSADHLSKKALKRQAIYVREIEKTTQ